MTDVAGNHSEVGSWCIVPLKLIEYGVCGDLILIYPEPYSIYMYNVKMEAVEGYRGCMSRRNSTSATTRLS